jgi:hypothetical protein
MTFGPAKGWNSPARRDEPFPHYVIGFATGKSGLPQASTGGRVADSATTSGFSPEIRGEDKSGLELGDRLSVSQSSESPLP